MKKSTLHVLFVLACLFQTLACRKDCTDCGALVEASVTLVDAKNRPVANRDVHLKGYLSRPQTQKTDGNGAVHFEFLWNSAELDVNSNWAIYPSGSPDFIRANLLVSPFSKSRLYGKLTISDTLTMDSLTTFHIRAKTSRNDVDVLYFGVKREGVLFDEDSYNGHSGLNFNYQNNLYTDHVLRQALGEVFLDYQHPSKTPQLDTTIEVKVPANVGFKVRCAFGYGSVLDSDSRSMTIGPLGSKDSTLLIEF